MLKESALALWHWLLCPPSSHWSPSRSLQLCALMTSTMLHSPQLKCFEHNQTSIPTILDPHQCVYWPKSPPQMPSPSNHLALSHMVNKDTHVRMCTCSNNVWYGNCSASCHQGHPNLVVYSIFTSFIYPFHLITSNFTQLAYVISPHLPSLSRETKYF